MIKLIDFFKRVYGVYPAKEAMLSGMSRVLSNRGVIVKRQNGEIVVFDSEKALDVYDKYLVERETAKKKRKSRGPYKKGNALSQPALNEEPIHEFPREAFIQLIGDLWQDRNALVEEVTKLQLQTENLKKELLTSRRYRVPEEINKIFEDYGYKSENFTVRA